MVSEARDLSVEHQQLGQAWIDAEQERIGILQKIIRDNAGKCTMDYPEDLFVEYEDSLARAAQANRAYFQWLAEQGLRSR